MGRKSHDFVYRRRKSCLLCLLNTNASEFLQKENMTEERKLSSNFDSIEADYKTVRGTGIPVSVWVPKSLDKGAKCAVAVRWHGGGLVTGSRLTQD